MLRCNGISGYAYQFEVLGGKSSSGPSADCNPPQSLGESEFAVLHMCMDLPLQTQGFLRQPLFQSRTHEVFVIKRNLWGSHTSC